MDMNIRGENVEYWWLRLISIYQNYLTALCISWTQSKCIQVLEGEKKYLKKNNDYNKPSVTLLT